MDPARQGKAPTGKTVLVFKEVLKFFLADVFGRREDVCPLGKLATQGFVEPRH